MNLTRTALTVLALLGAGLHLDAQPTITAVTNYASGDARLSPGSLATIAGTNLVSSLAVTIGGQPAPVLIPSTNGTYLVVQLSFNSALGSGTVTVGTSAAFPVTVLQYAPGLVTTIYHAASGAAISATSPANPGESISLYMTGLGPTNPPVAAGVVTPNSPPANVVTQPTVTVGNLNAPVIVAVLAPAETALYQVNVQLPSNLPLGSAAVVVSESGDVSNSVTIPVGPQTPVVSGVLSATGIPGSVQSNIESGSWVAIYGSNLANSTGDWTGLISNGVLPTSVNGVTVTFNGKPAAIYYVSPGQLDVQAPDTTVGTAQVVVNNNGLISAAGTANLQTVAPAFFQYGASKYAVATRYPDNAFLANPSLGASVFFPAKPGDYITLWCTGFGPTTPAQPAGMVVSGAPLPSSAITVTVGGTLASFLGAALSPGLAGVYQVVIQVPANTPSGDVLIQASVAGSLTPGNVYLYVAGN